MILNPYINDKLEIALNELILSLKLQSFKVHKECVLSEEEYLKLNLQIIKYQIPRNNGIINYSRFVAICYDKFAKMIEKGNSKELDWSKIEYSNFISDLNTDNSDYAINTNYKKQVNGHLELCCL